MIQNQYVGLRRRAQSRFDEFARYHSPVSMAASVETGTMLWFLLQTLRPNLVLETGSGYTTVVMAEWLQDQATVVNPVDSSTLVSAPTMYHVEEINDWKQRVLSYLKRTKLEPGKFIDYPDLYALKLDQPFLAFLDGLRPERPVVARFLIDSGAASRSVLLIDDAQAGTNEDVQESLDLLDRSSQGFLYDLAPWTLDEYGRSARLFVGFQSGFDVRHLYELETVPTELVGHRSTGGLTSVMDEKSAVERSPHLPLISIAITCYNQAAYIAEAIQSALDQTYPNTEIIVVNDGSSDDSLETIRHYAAQFPKRITVVDQENQGVVKARDAAIAAASGQYVVPLDGDDLLLPTALQTWLNFAQRHPEYAVIYSNAVRFRNDGTITRVHIPRQQRLKVEGNILSSHLGWGIVTATAFIDRQEVLKVGGYGFELSWDRGHEDFFLYVRLLVAGCKFGYVDRFSLLYRDYETSFSKNVERGNQAKYSALQYAFEHHIAQMVAAAQELTNLGLEERREKESLRLSLRQTQRDHARHSAALEADRQSLSQQVGALQKQLAELQEARSSPSFASLSATRLQLVRHRVSRGRSQQLLQTSYTLLRTEGPRGFMRRMRKWLAGERRYYRPSPVPATDAPTNHPSPPLGSTTQVSGRMSRGLTAGQAIGSRFPGLAALHAYPTTVTDRRLNVVTDSVNAGSLFGGVATSLILGALLSKHWGAPLRVVTRTEKAIARNFHSILAANAIDFDANVEFIYADQHDLDASIGIGAGDLFLTTSWWTTEAVRRTVGADHILYLLQEDERTFYPFGDDRVRCVNVLSDPKITFIVNSKLLFDHFAGDGLVNISQSGLWFEPSWSEQLFFREERPENRGVHNLFFYARPDHVRNLYYLGLEVLDTALKREVIRASDWHFHFVGKNVPEMHFDESVQITRHEGMSWADYAGLVRQMDLGLALMASPHPSYPPIDLAACGAVVVTNRYGTKQSLSAYSDNILCCDLKVEGLLQGLAEAQMLLQDRQRVLRQYRENQLLRNWDISFERVLQQLAMFGLQGNG